MRKDEAERAIIAEMRERLPSIPYRGADGGLAQFLELQRDRPDLFEFKSGAGDKWTLVQGWMMRRGMIR